ncbi:hypothetical protein IW492_05730 [Enterococcus sp. BWB1-3]|uniref:hypothetical protein n=1 Tax=Enterococcus sp. BWB1-3 TaxID=2787713 RepID=UPI0019233F92|nr:hypothetical protein [Enterococcus sp. BWB1-3]MBL1228732.1 hypothetical protein [Enterococcus sp. BWB1-3]
MKYTTRITLALSILAMVFVSAFFFKTWEAFILTAYPLIAGWFIGECLSIPEENVRTKWRRFKDSIAIRIINFADFIGRR